MLRVDFWRPVARTLFLLLFSACVTCAAPTPTAHYPELAPNVPPLVSIVAHVDTGFTPPERALLTVAAENLRVQTGGRMRVLLVDDLDFERTTSLVPPLGDWLLIRLLPDGPMAIELDSYFHANVLGACVSTQRHMFLIPARMDTNVEMVAVGMHELLHAAGVDHTKSRADVMYPSTSRTTATGHMTAGDLQAFCRVVGCASPVAP